MQLTTGEVDVTTRESRGRLPNNVRAYWCEFDKDFYLGYYKAETVRVWTARLGKGGGEREERLAFADDLEDADGIRILTFEQARAAARNWCAEQVIKNAQRPIDDRPFMTAGPACGRD